MYTSPRTEISQGGSPGTSQPYQPDMSCFGRLISGRLRVAVFVAGFTLAGCGTLLGLDATEETQGTALQDAGPDSDSASQDADASGETEDAADAPAPLEDADAEAAPVDADAEAAPVDADAEAAPVDADAASWDPLQLPGLVLWLDPAKGVSVDTLGGVMEWADQSPTKHPARQPSADRRPELQQQAIGKNPGVKYPGNWKYLYVPDHEDLQFGTGDFLIETVFLYAEMASSPCWGAGEAVVAKAEGQAPFDGVAIFGNAPTVDGIQTNRIGGHLSNDLKLNTPFACNDNQPRLVGLRRVGTTVELRVNGQVAAMLAPGANNDVDAVGLQFAIGGRESAMQCLDGVIGHVVAVKGPISSPDLANLEQWLMGWYADAI